MTDQVGERNVEAGYTLAEALAALLIVGLAMAGLAEGARQLGLLQAPVSAELAETRKLRRADAALATLLAARPASDVTFSGNARAFSFDCAGGCRAELTSTRTGMSLLVVDRGRSARFDLPARETVKWLYGTRNGRYDQWPPAGEPQVLRGVEAVRLTAEGEASLLAVNSWIEQPKLCEFDLITKTCRSSAP